MTLATLWYYMIWIYFLAPLGHRNKILREVKKIKAEELSGTVPDEFLCPITREIMTDPVIASGRYLINCFCTLCLLHVYMRALFHCLVSSLSLVEYLLLTYLLNRAY